MSITRYKNVTQLIQNNSTEFIKFTNNHNTIMDVLALSEIEKIFTINYFKIYQKY